MKEGYSVYKDSRYDLGVEDGIPFIRINGELYKLTCHPYEPCLYITGVNGNVTAVHNSFDPLDVIECFARGDTVTSVTGTEYDALDFCKMVEYAAGMYDLQIDEAEKVFSGRTKKKASEPEKERKKDEADINTLLPEAGKIIESDPAYDLIEKYPDCVIDFCLVKNERFSTGYNAHRNALLYASRKLFIDDNGEAIWNFNVGKADAKQIGTDDLLAPVEKNGKLNYRKAFLEPPYANGYTNDDFDRINAALFPNGTEELEIYEWTTDWSEYFDEGHEWWGALCLTVRDKTLDRFAVIMASATD